MLRSRRVWLDGYELSLPDQPLKLLVLLAEAIVSGRGLVPNRTIEEHLWAMPPRDGALRDAVRELREARVR